MLPWLKMKAGAEALAQIREGGLKASEIQVIAGAAGGPKWFVLEGLDRWLWGEFFRGRKQPLFGLGASIGAWRMAVAALPDPLAALERLSQAYRHQFYPDPRPSLRYVSAQAEAVLGALLGEKGASAIVQSPHFRLNIMTVRCLRGTDSDQRRELLQALSLAGLANLLARPALGQFFERALFEDPREPAPFANMTGFPLQRIALNAANLQPALLASGSIPLVMEGVRTIPEAPTGTYRDGGITDYHLDLPLTGSRPGLALFPHYSSQIIPGWLDKHLPWRKANPANFRRTLVIHPSAEFVARLPYQKIPDRHDFKHFLGRDAERLLYWEIVIEESQRLAEAFAEALLSGKIREQVEPLHEAG